jgi:hypothetical protein
VVLVAVLLAPLLHELVQLALLAQLLVPVRWASWREIKMRASGNMSEVRLRAKVY